MLKKLTAVFVLSLLLAGCARAPGKYDTFAQCLTDKGVKMYGSDTCKFCQAQKKVFEGSFDLVTYVECRRNADVCEKEKITGFPTWEINGTKKPGLTSLSELSELSSCPLTDKSPKT